MNKFQKKKIIIGTWSLSGDYGLIEKKKVIECLTCCVENGFIEFDTAPNYGNGFIDIRDNVNHLNDMGFLNKPYLNTTPPVQNRCPPPNSQTSAPVEQLDE